VYQNSNSESKILIMQTQRNRGSGEPRKHKTGSSHTAFLLRDYEIQCDWLKTKDYIMSAITQPLCPRKKHLGATFPHLPFYQRPGSCNKPRAVVLDQSVWKLSATQRRQWNFRFDSISHLLFRNYYTGRNMEKCIFGS
jgi:hypothetical protein